MSDQPSTLQRLIRFVGPAASELGRRHALQGRFHSHITVRVDDEAAITRLRAFCRERRIKLTLIDLESFDGRSQLDVMTTQYDKVDSTDAVETIVARLVKLAEQLDAAGFHVIRVKLEHEDLPTLPEFDRDRYREIHIKLRMQPADYAEVMQTLRDLAPAHGFVPSRNPNEQADDFVTQFLNMRIYSGSLAEADDRVAAVLTAVEELPVEVVDVKRETTVFDTDQHHDGWWA